MAPRLEVARDVGDFVLVRALHDDGVDLDRSKTSVGSGVDPFQHLADAVAEAGDPTEDVVVQGLDADGHPVEAGVGQRLRLGAEQGAVRGQRQVLDSPHGGQNPDEFLDVPPQQGLAAGEPQFADTKSHEQPHQAFDLLEGHQLLPGQELVLPVRRHAEGAAEVAAVDDRDAQVAHRPAEPVGDRESRGVAVRGVERHERTMLRERSALAAQPVVDQAAGDGELRR